MNKDYSVLDGIIKNAGHELKTAFDKGYAQGVEHATNELGSLANAIHNDPAEFEKGRKLSIAIVQWLFRHVPDKELFDGNYVEDIINQYSLEEIEEAIESYEERPRYGDEVKSSIDGRRAIVIYRIGGACDKEGLYKVFDGDEVGAWEIEWFNKTGRHFDSITQDVIRDLLEKEKDG